MAQTGVNRDTVSCSICLDLLKDPVTTHCGHNYCMNCIKSHWDREEEKKIYSCPQCRKSFTPRPVLGKNTMLAALVEELKKTGLQDAPADHCYAGPEDVACDVCTGRKLKALKSCLVCLASYCEKHLQTHYDVAPLRKHKLVEPSKNLQNICPLHDEVMKMFCRNDQMIICILCSMDEHKGHNTVSAAAERTERQRELEERRQNIQLRIQDREEDVKVLQHEVGQEITELKRKDVELKKFLYTEDHNQFLHNYPSVSALSEDTHSSSINIRPLKHFEDVTAAVTEARDKLQDLLTQTWTNISWKVMRVNVLLPQPEPEPEPKTRAEFLKYSREITLDPNTAETWLFLSEGNRKVTNMGKDQSYSRHPDRFTGCFQVLSSESLTGRCYWEVERSWWEIEVAVAYKNISRAGATYEFLFGRNDKSWSLNCFQNIYSFWFNNSKTPVSGPWSSRVGVYLDHSAGILSFYSVSETMTLLHRVQTTFTQPLHAGLYVYSEATAEFIKLK